MLTTAEKAQELSKDQNIKIQLHSFGSARAELAHMPQATIPAAQRALKNADLTISDIDVIKSHNPFAVNDIVFARQMGVNPNRMNKTTAVHSFGGTRKGPPRCER